MPLTVPLSLPPPDLPLLDPEPVCELVGGVVTAGWVGAIGAVGAGGEGVILGAGVTVLDWWSDGRRGSVVRSAAICTSLVVEAVCGTVVVVWCRRGRRVIRLGLGGGGRLCVTTVLARGFGGETPVPPAGR